ncbi:MAG: hypothetical protein PUB18_04910 [bacterium]|nr:hypothetical protein [bacterium]
MYNFELMDNEKVIKIFDEIMIKQEDNQKITTIALTNKRLLFLDYLTPNEGLEVLRIARGANYIKYKEVYYQIDLNEITDITKGECYQVVLENKMIFEFDDDELYNLLKR